MSKVVFYLEGNALAGLDLFWSNMQTAAFFFFFFFWKVMGRLVWVNAVPMRTNICLELHQRESNWLKTPVGLMSDSICHSSLPRTVLEKVTLTTIKFRIYPRTKVDPLFYCVYIRTPLKS